MTSAGRFLLFLSLIFLVVLGSCTTVGQPVKLSPLNAEVVFPDFTDVVSRLAPSVVAISTEKLTYDNLKHAIAEAGSGSGWILSEDGMVVTNDHVVDGADSIQVELYDHKGYKARLIRTDPIADLAVIKIDAGRNLTPLAIADSTKIKVGQWVLIMGNPLGLGISAKQGTVSRLGVTMASSPEQTYYNLIETSAAVNPGNSGGPMVNLNGEIIGITSLKIDAAGVEGMGYAIPVSDALATIEVLVQGKDAPRPSLGLSVTSVDNGLALRYELSVEFGALVMGIAPGGPAVQSGLGQGDVIVGFDSQAISNASELNRQVALAKPGQKVKLTYWRASEQKVTEVTVVAAGTLR